MKDGGYLWLDYEKALEIYEGEKMFPADVEALSLDNNRTVTFVKVIAERKAE